MHQSRQILIKAITFFKLLEHYGGCLITAGPKIKVFAEITWLISEESKWLTFVKNIVFKAVRCTTCLTYNKNLVFCLCFLLERLSFIWNEVSELESKSGWGKHVNRKYIGVWKRLPFTQHRPFSRKPFLTCTNCVGSPILLCIYHIIV